MFLFKAVMQKSSGDLLSKLNSIPGSQPIGSRISSMWHYWQDGLHFLETKKDNINMRTKKKVSCQCEMGIFNFNGRNILFSVLRGTLLYGFQFIALLKLMYTVAVRCHLVCCLRSLFVKGSVPSGQLSHSVEVNC